MSQVEIDTSRNGHNPWISKQEAAARLGVSVRTIEAYASKRELGSRLQPVAGSKPVTVINLDDVERKFAEQHRGAILPGLAVSQAEAAPLVPRTVTPEFAGGMMAAFRQAFAAPLPEPQKPFLTLAAASEYTGLPEKLLRRLIRQKRLAAESFRERAGRGGTVMYVKTADLRAIQFGDGEDSKSDVEESRDLREAAMMRGRYGR